MTVEKKLYGAAALAAEKAKKKIYVAPIPKAGVTYRIPNLEIHPDTQMPRCPSSQGIPPEDDIWVNEKGEPCPPNLGVELVHIEFITGTRAVKRPGGVTEQVPTKGSLELIWGEMRVAPHELKKFEYVEVCNYNGSNPNRREDKPILFEKVDIEGAKIVQAQKERDVRKALNDLEDLWQNERPAMKEYAESLGININDQAEDAILADLEMRCKADYKNFIKNSHSAKTPVKALVKRAIQIGEITLARDLNKIFWRDKTEITGTPPGVNQEEFFADWLILNEQNKALDLLKRKVEGE